MYRAFAVQVVPALTDSRGHCSTKIKLLKVSAYIVPSFSFYQDDTAHHDSLGSSPASFVHVLNKREAST